MKNIHILPGDIYKPSRLYFKDGDYKLDTSSIAMDWFISSAGYKPHNIYITSDGEIKDGEWCYYENGDLKGIHKVINGQRPKTIFLKKIILTTDQDLIKDGIQAIDDEFLEWFVKNPSCEKVELGLEHYFDKNIDKSPFFPLRYKIIIPKEKMPKWEALNKELDDVLNSMTPEDWDKWHKGVVVTPSGVGQSRLHEQETFIKPDTIDGEWLSPISSERQWQEEQLINIFEHYPNASPKWQYMNGLIQNSLDAKEMYSEEDMKKAFEAGKKGYMRGSYLTQEYYFTWNNFKSWFEQFKKK